MKNKLIAQRYVRAILANISSDQNDSILNDVAMLDLIFIDEVKQKLCSKLLRNNKKKELASLLVEGTENKELWLSLLLLLVDKNRLSVISEILSGIDDAVLAAQNKERVLLKLATEQKPEIVDSIKARVARILNKEVIFKIEIDPELIGGFEAISDSKIINASVKNSLEKFISGR